MDVPAKLKSLFPRHDEIPAEADFAPGGGVCDQGVCFLIDGQVRRWSGAVLPVLSPVFVEKDGRLAPREMGL